MKAVVYALPVFVCLTIGCGEAAPTQDSVSSRVPDASSKMEPFKCEVTLDLGDESFTANVCFHEHFAVEFDPADKQRVRAVYNLDAMSWIEMELRQTVTLDDCERWAEASAARTRNSLSDALDGDVKRFVQLSLEPQFVISADESAVTLTNDLLNYRITNPISMDRLQLKRFFAYDRLNAYRKAMAERKVPPFAQLEVDAELERRGIVPGTIDLRIQTPQGELQLLANVSVTKMAESETARVLNAVQEATETGP